MPPPKRLRAAASSGGSSSSGSSSSSAAPELELVFEFKDYRIDDDEEEKEDDEEEGEDDNLAEGESFVTIIGHAHTAAGDFVGKVKAYLFDSTRGRSNGDWVSDADELSQSVYNTVAAATEDNGIRSELKRGLWADGVDTGALLVVEDVRIAQAHRGRRLGLQLLRALLEWVADSFPECNLALLTPGFTDPDSCRGWSQAKRDATWAAQVAYWQAAGFRTLAAGTVVRNTPVLAYVFDSDHASRAAPAASVAQVAAASAAAGVVKATLKAQVAQEEARALARGLRGEALRWHMSVFCNQLGLEVTGEGDAQAAAIARLKARYPGIVKQTLERGEPLHHLLSFPPLILSDFEESTRASARAAAARSASAGGAGAGGAGAGGAGASAGGAGSKRRR